jgi:hypothetical protein
MTLVTYLSLTSQTGYPRRLALTRLLCGGLSSPLLEARWEARRVGGA